MQLKYVDSPSHLGQPKHSSIMPTTGLHSSHTGLPIFAVVSFMYGILLSYAMALVCKAFICITYYRRLS